MYNIIIDNDSITVDTKIVSATDILECIGEEPNDCVLVSVDNVIFKGDVDLSIYDQFKTVHPDFIPSYWLVGSTDR